VPRGSAGPAAGSAWEGCTPTALDDAPEANVAGWADPVHHENQVIDLQGLSWGERGAQRTGPAAGSASWATLPESGASHPPAAQVKKPLSQCLAFMPQRWWDFSRF